MKQHALLALVWLACATIVVRGLMVPANLAWGVHGRVERGEKTDPTSYLSGLATAKSALPPDSILGYIADRPLDFVHPSQDLALYYLAQFAVAPMLLDPRTERDIILANYSSPALLQQRLKTGDLVLVRALAPGQAILKQAKRP